MKRKRNPFKFGDNWGFYVLVKDASNNKLQPEYHCGFKTEEEALVALGAYQALSSKKETFTNSNKVPVAEKLKQDVDAEYDMSEMGIKYLMVDIPKDILLGDYADLWIMQKCNVFKYNTYLSYRNCIDNYIVPYFGERVMRDISRIDVAKFYTKMCEVCNRPQAKQIRVVLKRLFLFAKADGIDVILIDDIYLPRQQDDEIFIEINDKFDIIKGDPGQINKIIQKKYRNPHRVYNAKQVVEFLEAIEDPSLMFPVMFSSVLGLRRNESMAIKFNDFDFETKTLSISRQIGNKKRLYNDDISWGDKTKQEIPTKTISGTRVIDVPDFVLEAVKNRYKEYCWNMEHVSGFQDTQYVAAREDGSIYSPSALTQKYADAMESCGLPKITWSDLRHSVATRLSDGQVSLKAISRMLGHRKTYVTADHYVEEMYVQERSMKVAELFFTNLLGITPPDDVELLDGIPECDDLEDIENNIVQFKR